MPKAVETFLSKLKDPRIVTHKYDVGEAIYRTGDAAKSIFWLRIGRLKTTVPAEIPGHTDPVVAITEAGEFFGEAALLHPPRRVATVTAMIPCEIVELPNEAALEAMGQQPGLAIYIIRHLLHDRRQRGAMAMVRRVGTLEQRVAFVLLSLEKFGAVPTGVTQQMIGELCDISRARTSTILNAMKAKGMIHYNATIDLDMPKLIDMLPASVRDFV
jgi:CRP-like cAMP-binding protein